MWQAAWDDEGVDDTALIAALRAAGQAESCQPLFGSLVADPSALARLDWVPPVKTEAGLAALLRAERSS